VALNVRRGHLALRRFAPTGGGEVALDVPVNLEAGESASWRVASVDVLKRGQIAS
jgi:hypothetical protein